MRYFGLLTPAIWGREQARWIRAAPPGPDDGPDPLPISGPGSRLVVVGDDGELPTKPPADALELSEDGGLVLRLRRPWRDGTRAFVSSLTHSVLGRPSRTASWRGRAKIAGERVSRMRLN